ncbi:MULTISPECIES: ATP phosphoribosyltransferase regulatory subunit [unclassified Campylobacter]|uniref:ATP phosphoribosyltransferase regulatory subunit n=1 Tax=unclassified Campylobacter TaxID=2593542 RepID=UPI0022E9C211|nr:MULTISPECIES: ATP phosphoribosyltransferase regulatory subunit [unclassified Campylobacter]MDA3043123.1 ATP phosphoribosyltransferase regulatory subunit [Campylobacter sp. JMF_09 ED2]MDA3044839.1 ATP phosphoribosyltransferase regulatory subunit [Campylobacter sp. JMF_07 ED4]MDA3047427.1 ATP phosphoribosyltransferase regulatory subunit [Campylobacter sp. JMF_08 NE1]MDA3049710.1 ATP phosphoribosyltransferase regulatory subunit [Campylobacter sp. JMF_15 NE4]MDA3050668.1 ATP phosphoribosyltrans
MINSVSADFDHEIPNGSRLYFGTSAKLKRELENKASKILENHGFSEILTPYFSYHQHLSVAGAKLLKFSDPSNHEIALRADSTVDVVRIVRRRLKDESLKRLFYIQPTFKYPSEEFYQIGAELIDESNLALAIKIAIQIFREFSLEPVLQLSNIEIPKRICEILNLPISVFEKGEIETILAQNCDWLGKTARATNLGDVENLRKIVPEEIKPCLDEILNLGVEYKNIRVSLLYYSKMRYYKALFFRFLDENSVLCNGGNYEIDGLKSSGFALLVDALIEKLMIKD